MNDPIGLLTMRQTELARSSTLLLFWEDGEICDQLSQHDVAFVATCVKNITGLLPKTIFKQSIAHQHIIFFLTQTDVLCEMVNSRMQ